MKIIISGWGGTRSVIAIRYQNSPILDSSGERNLLSDAEYRPFWISWFDHEVQVGKGDIVGEQVLLTGWY